MKIDFEKTTQEQPDVIDTSSDLTDDIFYNPDDNCFYFSKEKSLYDEAGTWPKNPVMSSKKEWEDYGLKSPPDGKMRGHNSEGGPGWVDMPSPPDETKSSIETKRIRAYVDPITGSDRIFAEAMRMQIMGEEGYEEVRARAVARFEEIQAHYPWPAK